MRALLYILITAITLCFTTCYSPSSEEAEDLLTRSDADTTCTQNGKTNDYMIDTGSSYALELPLAESKNAKHRLEKFKSSVWLVDKLRVNKGRYDEDADVQFGSKHIKCKAIYSDLFEKRYSVNPLLLFDEIAFALGKGFVALR